MRRTSLPILAVALAATAAVDDEPVQLDARGDLALAMLAAVAVSAFGSPR